MESGSGCDSCQVHYRIGSLENRERKLERSFLVHYRIGSLEIIYLTLLCVQQVHYRIGSLENAQIPPKTAIQFTTA